VPNQSAAGTPQKIEVILQPAPAAGGLDWLGAGTELAWPLAALLIVIVLRRSIADALMGLSARAKSLSLGIVAFDFGEAAVKGLTPESLDDIRDTASHAPVGDSGAALIATLTDPTPAECTVVNLGDGREWITSRLYAVVTLVARMRGLRVMVFTATDQGARRFVGSTQPEQLRWALAAAYPWLEVAYIRAWNNDIGALHSGTVERVNMSLSMDGRVEPLRAVQTFEAFKQELQAPAPPLGASGWLDLSGKCERADWVTPALLMRVLGEGLNQRAVQHDFDTKADELARRVLRFPLDYVPTVDRSGNFLRIVARRQYVSRTLRQVADGV
jgi:hypothetical protein